MVEVYDYSQLICNDADLPGYRAGQDLCMNVTGRSVRDGAKRVSAASRPTEVNRGTN